jgi:DNA-directed RNA polymerase subunit RPC12/RpoP
MRTEAQIIRRHRRLYLPVTESNGSFCHDCHHSIPYGAPAELSPHGRILCPQCSAKRLNRKLYRNLRKAAQ